MPRPSPEASAKEIIGILEARSAEAGHVDLISEVKASGFTITLVSGDKRTT